MAGAVEILHEAEIAVAKVEDCDTAGANEKIKSYLYEFSVQQQARM